MSNKNLVLDLRNKTVQEITELVKKYGLGSGRFFDITKCYKFYWPDYEGKITVISLDDMKAGECEFILWDGRLRKTVVGRDLHFFDSGGKGECGMANTLDRMQ